MYSVRHHEDLGLQQTNGDVTSRNPQEAKRENFGHPIKSCSEYPDFPTRVNSKDWNIEDMSIIPLFNVQTWPNARADNETLADHYLQRLLFFHGRSVLSDSLDSKRHLPRFWLAMLDEAIVPALIGVHRVAPWCPLAAWVAAVIVIFPLIRL
jgi:hypothetical protein